MSDISPLNVTGSVRHPRRWGRLWTGLAMIALVACVVLGVRRWRTETPPAPAVAVPLAELVLHEGRLVRTGDTNAFTGWMEEHHPGAGLKSRSWISAGRLDGVSEGWFTNGVLQVREHFVAGLSEGTVTRWHETGTMQSEGTALAGKLEGTFRRWHENGVLSEELHLRAGQPEGLSRAWFPSGCPKAEVTLKDGKIVTQQFWKDGERPSETTLAQAGSNP
jgi:antitoxin component YwqK of YwqJK toxin-antitoxin module